MLCTGEPLFKKRQNEPSFDRVVTFLKFCPVSSLNKNTEKMRNDLESYMENLRPHLMGVELSANTAGI